MLFALILTTVALTGPTASLCPPQAERPLVRGALALTFDDRNYAGWDAVLPVLAKYGAHVTFCISGPINERARTSITNYSAVGHSIAVHALEHKPLMVTNTAEEVEGWYRMQIKPQVEELAKLGIKVTALAYPGNRRSAVSDRVLGKYFRHVRAGLYCKRGTSLVENDAMFHSPEDIRRTTLLSGVGIGERYVHDFPSFAAALKRCSEKNEVLCTYSHKIAPGARGGNCPLELLEQILAEAKRLGVAIVGYDELP